MPATNTDTAATATLTLTATLAACVGDPRSCETPGPAFRRVSAYRSDDLWCSCDLDLWEHHGVWDDAQQCAPLRVDATVNGPNGDPLAGVVVLNHAEGRDTGAQRADVAAALDVRVHDVQDALERAALDLLVLGYEPEPRPVLDHVPY